MSKKKLLTINHESKKSLRTSEAQNSFFYCVLHTSETLIGIPYIFMTNISKQYLTSNLLINY